MGQIAMSWRHRVRKLRATRPRCVQALPGRHRPRTGAQAFLLGTHRIRGIPSTRVGRPLGDQQHVSSGPCRATASNQSEHDTLRKASWAPRPSPRCALQLLPALASKWLSDRPRVGRHSRCGRCLARPWHSHCGRARRRAGSVLRTTDEWRRSVRSLALGPPLRLQHITHAYSSRHQPISPKETRSRRARWRSSS